MPSTRSGYTYPIFTNFGNGPPQLVRSSASSSVRIARDSKSRSIARRSHMSLDNIYNFYFTTVNHQTTYHFLSLEGSWDFAGDVMPNIIYIFSP